MKDNNQSQSGAVLVITLLVLLAVTVLGVASLQTTSVELNIARNEREIRETFYLAEGAAMEGIQRLKAVPAADLEEGVFFWHHDRGSESIENDKTGFRDPARWQMDSGARSPNCMQSAIDPDTYFAAVNWGVAPGGSLVQTGSRLYQHRVYGLCTKHGANQRIEIGYFLRY
jgi:hypothetical protein